MSLERSVIMPAFNESEGLIPVVQEVAAELEKQDRSFEIILVDDGSRDDTWSVIQGLHDRIPQVRGLRFARNFGHQLAVHAGLKAAQGQLVAVMDADGQDPAELLTEMFDLIEQGHDVVNCVRKDRKESGFKRFCYYAFYRVYGRLVPFPIPLDSGDFSAMNRRTVDVIARVNQHTPFIRGIRSWTGGSQYELAYERQERRSGETKYSLRKLIMLAATGVTAFSKVPLRLSIIVGMTISAASLMYALAIFLMKILTGYPEGYAGWTSIACLVSFLGGAQLTVLGIIGEYLGHIFDAVRGMPAYHVAEQLGFDETMKLYAPDGAHELVEEGAPHG